MKYNFSDLLQIMARLRAPNGCPWDKEQTHLTLIPYLFEESTELAEAIHAGDSPHVCEELGDVLLQVIFHAQVAHEAGHYHMDDVVHGIAEKLVRRHPHVFAESVAETAEAVTVQWDAIKKQEKGADYVEKKSLMDKVKRSLPSLMRAQALQNRAAKVGFDWPDVQGVLDKVKEESEELGAEIKDAQTRRSPEEAKQNLPWDDQSRSRIESELGDLIFVMANLARHAGVDAEQALIRSNAKFERRFRRIEELALQKNLQLEGMSLEEMDVLWDQAKAEERLSG